MPDDFVTRESKLTAAKDIVANYVRSDAGGKMSADEVCDLLKKVYNTVEDLVPEPEERRVGLA